MSQLIYTTEQLISTVRLRSRVPNTTIPGTADADIVLLLNEEMRTRMIAGLMKPHEFHFIKSMRIPLVAGTTRYRIPHRAVGLKVQNIVHIGTNNERNAVHQVGREEIRGAANTGSGIPASFYVEGPWMIMYPDLSSSYTGNLELSFYLRPGDLVKSDEYFKVASITDSTSIVLESSVPASWTAAEKYDVQSPLSGGDCVIWDRAVSTVSGTNVTFSEVHDGTIFGDTPLQVGDYFVKTGTAAVPGLPSELHVPLALAAASALVMPLQPELAMTLKRSMEEMLAAAGYIIARRVESSPPVANKPNPLYGQGSR